MRRSLAENRRFSVGSRRDICDSTASLLTTFSSNLAVRKTLFRFSLSPPRYASSVLCVFAYQPSMSADPTYLSAILYINLPKKP
jgi:hypothetical protein